MPFVSYYYVIEFPRAKTFLYIQTHWGTCQNIGFVQQHVHCSRRLVSLYGVFLCKTACILSALELHFTCIESAIGLHIETSGLPKLAGLQSCRKLLWELSQLSCRTWNVLLRGILLYCLAKLSLASVILQYAFLLPLCVWAACYTKSISKAVSKEMFKRIFLKKYLKGSNECANLCIFSALTLVHQEVYSLKKFQ